MKSLKERILESIEVDEAQRIMWGKLSDEDLLLQYWDQWSGLASNGAHSGLSSNSGAQRALDELYNRFDDAYDVTMKFVDLNEYVCKKAGVSSFDRFFFKKIADEMHRMIKLNKDWLISGSDHDKSEIKDK